MGWPYQQKPPMGWPLDYDSGLADFVGAWFMPEGTGSKVFDLSSNGNHGTFVGDVSWGTGSNGSILNFPGSADYINCGSNDSLNLFNQITIIVRASNDDISSADNSIIGRGNSTDHWWMLMNGASGDDGRIKFFCGGVETQSIQCWTANNQYRTVVVTYNNSDNVVNFYRDGVFLSTDGGGNSVTKPGATTYIGVDARDAGGLDFFGNIDYIYVFNRILSIFEIALLYREPFCMFKDPAEIALLGGYQAAGGTILPQIINAYMRVSA